MLIPVKAFHAAKARLSPTVAAADRATLACWMAGRADRSRPAATDVRGLRRRYGREVGGVARRLGAVGAWPRSQRCRRLRCRATIAGKGFDDVIISHGDLPIPRLAAGTRARGRDRHRSRPAPRRNERHRAPMRDPTPRNVWPGLVSPPSRSGPHVRSPGDGSTRHRALARPRHGRRSDPPADPSPCLRGARNSDILWDNLGDDRREMTGSRR